MYLKFFFGLISELIKRYVWLQEKKGDEIGEMENKEMVGIDRKWKEIKVGLFNWHMKENGKCDC